MPTMKNTKPALAIFSLLSVLLQGVHAQDAPTTTTTSGEVEDRAIDPTASGQIGINPPTEFPSGWIGVNTEYLTDLGTTTKWIGVDPVHISIATVTTSGSGDDKPAEATFTQVVKASKNGDGGLDILISPGIKDKLEAIAEKVTPCSAARLRRRQGPSCGLAQFHAEISNDPELSQFGEQLTESAMEELSAASDTDEDSDGDSDSDTGNDSDSDSDSDRADSETEADEDGFYPTDEGADEALVFSSEEEAAAIAEGIAAGDGVALGGQTLAAGSFLAILWKAIEGGGKLEHGYKVPKESIHTITKTKSEDDSETETTTTGDSCPTATDMPTCGSSCAATSHAAKPTGDIEWACSKGETKDCDCELVSDTHGVPRPADLEKVLWEAAEAGASDGLDDAESSCESMLTNVPVKMFSNVSEAFCGNLKDDDEDTYFASLDLIGSPINVPAVLDTTVRPADVVNRVTNALTLPSRVLIPEQYREYVFSLKWAPKDDSEDECSSGPSGLCTDAFDKMTSDCGKEDGFHNVTYGADVDVGCGKFELNVVRRPSPPEDDDDDDDDDDNGDDDDDDDDDEEEEEEPKPFELQERKCHDAHKKKQDTQDGQQKSFSSMACRYFGDKPMKGGDETLGFSPPGIMGAWNLVYKVSWMCVTEERSQSVQDPLGDGSVSCESLMREMYVRCEENGGAGGSRRAGCLKYDFYAR